MIKATLIQERAWENNGYTGLAYAGFKEGGGVVQFITSRSHEIHPGETAFNPANCEQLDLEARIWNDQVKWREVGAEIQQN